MADPSVFDAVRLPSAALVVLDWRPLHFAMQRYHYLVRLGHVVSMAAFYGGIALLDLRLMGVRGAVRLKPFADHVLPALYITFGVATVTGVALFLYDPVHVGAHAYFTPKLIAIALGLVNAVIYNRTGYLKALSAEERLPASARIAGALSLAFWTAAVAFACLNVEPAPRVILR
jgi:hypothetical protein